jgi:hypothetical protein
MAKLFMSMLGVIQGVLLVAASSVTVVPGCTGVIVAQYPKETVYTMLSLSITIIACTVAAAIGGAVAIGSPEKQACLRCGGICVSIGGSACFLLTLLGLLITSLTYLYVARAQSAIVRLMGINEWDVALGTWDYLLRPDLPLAFSIAINRVAGVLAFCFALLGAVIDLTGFTVSAVAYIRTRH